MEADNLSFAQLATAIEKQYSRQALVAELGKLLDPPQGVSPTSAHKIALELFDQIITTNWDSLFETALIELGDNRAIIHASSESELPTRFLVKFHGSISSPETITISEQEVYRFQVSSNHLWKECANVVSEKAPIFIGTSLNDPSVIRLIQESKSPTHGFIVVPHPDALETTRLSSWGLTVIDATADEFLLTLRDVART